MANGGPYWHESVPAWVKAVAFLVGTVGFPIVTAGYFMARDAGVFKSPLARIEERAIKIDSDLGDAVKAMGEVVRRRDDINEKLLHVQVETCRAAAKSAKDREQELRCDYWRR